MPQKSKFLCIFAAFLVFIVGLSLTHLGRRFAFQLVGSSRYLPIPYEAKNFLKRSRNHLIPNSATIFMGDSLIEFADWEELIPGHGHFNAGIGGITTARFLEQKMLQYTSPENQLVLLIGINDFWKNTPLPDIKLSFVELLGRLRVNRVKKLILVGILPFDKPELNRRTSEIELLNQWLEEECQNSDFVFINAKSALGIDQSMRIAKKYSSDGVHLTRQGYEKLAALIKPHLKESP